MFRTLLASRYFISFSRRLKMSVSSSRLAVLSLYKSMLREAQNFSDFNYRRYFVRRIRDGFREFRSISDESQVSEKIRFAKKNLDIIKRQVFIGKMFETGQSLSVEMKGSTLPSP